MRCCARSRPCSRTRRACSWRAVCGCHARFPPPEGGRHLSRQRLTALCDASRQVAQPAEGISMQIGFCGLGRMGAAMVARLLDQGQKPVVWNRNPDKIKPLVTKGAR
ncbi:MAG TPA: NAD(P)-binding domain-containing protein, partial [Stellaceae bacterium]|nr:NAD(P)-binding domain-containing protein [Stellaceae bacterium]